MFSGQSQGQFSTVRVPRSGQTPNVQRSTLNIQLRYLLKVGSWMLKVESWMLNVFRTVPRAVQHGQGASVGSNAQRPTLNAEHPTALFVESWKLDVESWKLDVECFPDNPKGSSARSGCLGRVK